MKTFVIILMVLAAATAVAQPPRTMNFQGTLADGSSVTLPDGNYNLTFRLWDSDIGGAQLWTETISVNLSSGIFNTILGETTPLLLPFDQPYFLGIAVGLDPELSPRAPLTGMPYAMNVADGAVVQSLNGRVDDLSIVGGANISVNVVGNDIIINGTGALTDADWNVVGSNMTSIPVGNVGIGEAAPATKLHVGGDATLGNPAAAGKLFAYNGGGFLSELGGNYFDEGSELLMREETGGIFFGVQPDFDGTGGFLWLRNGNSGFGFLVDGDFDATGSPRITMSGNNSSVIFDLEETGNSAAQLPASSIAAPEILDEPGVASELAGGPIDLTTSNTTMISRTIVCPAAGYVFVQGMGEIDITHVNGTVSFGTMGVSDITNTLPLNQDQTYYLPSTAGSGVYLSSTSPSGLFPVTAGSNTFYLVARKNSGGVDVRVWDMQLTCMYFPTAYGTVNGTKSADKAEVDQFSGAVPSMPAPSFGDLAAEQAAAEAFDRDRVDRELAAMRRQLEELQRQVENMNSAAGTR